MLRHHMGRLGTIIVWVTTMLAPLIASAEAPVRASTEQGMCSEMPGQVDLTPTQLQSASAAPDEDARAESLSPLDTDAAQWGSWMPVVIELESPTAPAAPDPVLWCLTPDDPRCAPIEHNPTAQELAGGHYARPTACPVIGPAGPTESFRPGSTMGGPRSAHQAGVERPPRP